MIINITIALVGILASFAYFLLISGSRDKRFPTGPPTLPIIGNLHQLPRRRAHLKYTELAKQYGGLYTVKAGHHTIAVITDRRIVRELIEERGSTASNRPSSYIIQHLIGKNDHLLTLQYGQNWRVIRKLIHQHFTDSMCDKAHVHLQHAEGVQMLRDFIVDPDNHMQHPRRYSCSIMTSTIYGVRIPSIKSTYMEHLYEMLDTFTALLELGATPPVDFYPFLKWIPERFLGNWRTRSYHVKGIMESLHQGMYKHVLARRASVHEKEKATRIKSPSLMDKIFDVREDLNFSTHKLSFIGGGLVEGGSETPACMILTFIGAMTKWPSIQKRAQAEIDSIIGEDRSPTWADYARLPYVAAIVKECSRWRPVAPLGMPHSLDADEWIDGHLLPRGATLIINIWGLNHDETYYPNPESFNPDRFYIPGTAVPLAHEYMNKADYNTRDHYSYGAGRRFCTGIHLAERDMFIAMAMLLWAFNFEKPFDPTTGLPMEPDLSPDTGFVEGLVACPAPFPCKVSLRSGRRYETIMREFEEAKIHVFAKYDEKVEL
ncbi:uncharacterized protein BHQ10_001913 [Talaromyces amestolkiae]|uniref:Cytochrome P450 n=1 Tax=Talaromyces amestolkiae TaxID=1196081 RepID=A0A364KQW0_TALAM|nr:uncharacterized protein BHQ10_001913 [Talaromyces amestolkiae]RAO65901.1 hypothetical protein BHQ10_001913 [Talaromyces amestolkiae]